MDKKDFETIRRQIDLIDDELLARLNKRAGLVLDLARVKFELGKKMFDPARESEIYARLTGKNSGPLSSEAVMRLFERIIDESRRLERTEVYDKDEE
jgi:chorismate mutase